MSRRPPRPDLDPGDRVLIAAHLWQRRPDRSMWWLPTGNYRWRVVDRLVYDTWSGWNIHCEPTAPHHPSREQPSAVRAVLRAGGEKRPAPVVVAKPKPVQLGLFEVAS